MEDDADERRKWVWEGKGKEEKEMGEKMVIVMEREGEEEGK